MVLLLDRSPVPGGVCAAGEEEELAHALLYEGSARADHQKKSSCTAHGMSSFDIK